MTNSIRIAYRIARGAIVLAALLWVFSAVAGYLVLPELHYDDHRSIPPASERQLAFAGSLLGAILIAAPYRWTMRRWPFNIRFAAFCVLSLWLIRGAGFGLVGYLRGTKHWLVVPVSGALLAVAIILPLTLLVARRIYRAEETAA